MIVTGPARDGTRLGLIDVGVPRCICWRLVRTTGLLFYWRRRDGMGNLPVSPMQSSGRKNRGRPALQDRSLALRRDRNGS